MRTTQYINSTMEGLIFIIVAIILVALMLRSSQEKMKKEPLLRDHSSKDNDSKRSLPHPNDTILGTAEPMNQTQAIQEKLDQLSKLPADSPNTKGIYLFFDTETTGLPRKQNADPEDFSNWPYIVDIAWFLTDENGLLVDGSRYIIKQNVSIPEEASAIHRITTEKMLAEGYSPQEVYTNFLECVNNAEYIIAHNLDFDLPIVECELLRNGFNEILFSKKKFCTMKAGRKFCEVYDRLGRIKNPRLSELFCELYFDDPTLHIEGTHSAVADTNLLYRSFMKMKELNPLLLEDQEYESNSFPYNKIDVSTDKLEIKDDVEIPMLTNEQLRDFLDNGSFNGSEVLVTGTSPAYKQKSWDMITDLNGKVVKSVTKKLKFVVLGYIPGPKKVEAIKDKIKNGEAVIGLSEDQLRMLHIFKKDA